MFAEAYKIVSSFTYPVVISTRHYNGTVNCACGSFIFLNKNGWFLSAFHIMNSFLLFKKQRMAIQEYEEKAMKINNNSSLKPSQKRNKLKNLGYNPNWITNHSFWWGMDGLILDGDLTAFPKGDLVIGKLTPFNPELISAYPRIKNPKSLPPGRNLCKLGFPFHEINAIFDDSTSAFRLTPGSIPIPRFPLEGIFTRTLVIKESTESEKSIKFIETSSPGLRGQSGGPIFDINGAIWGIQSHTKHFPLGFSPKLTRNGREIEENQFLNVGIGSHPETIVSFLEDNGIEFNETKD